MKTIFGIFLLLFSIFLIGCNKQIIETQINQANSSLHIKAGFICGWGTGTDSLDITQTTINYVYYIPSRSQSPKIKKSRAVPESEWSEIQNCVNLDDFSRLHYQSCAICVDGCDEWISIQDDGYFHKITYGKGSEIDTISKLQTKLAQLRTEFSN